MWILVVEDEPAMGAMLRQGLEEANHTVTLVRDGAEALAALESAAFDTVILDVMIPGLSGLDVVRRLRAAKNQVPVLMLTARDAPTDIVIGLDAGADDYLVKPFAFNILLARLRAVSRRGATTKLAALQVGDLKFDPVSRQVTRAGNPITLTATEFRFLEAFMRRPGKALSRSAIIEAVWGFDEDVERNTVDTYVKLLRDKIDGKDRPRLIHTVRGYGYILREP
jgi:DNA-binding response OmpR family regulator